MRISEVVLELDHVETSEVWLKLNISNSKTEQDFIIERDGQNIAEGKALGDTILIDEGLLPNHTYTYVAYLFDKIKTTPTKPVNVTTGDTTSHNFTWTIDTLGRYPSYFNDVTIIDENNIWACGEIRTDSGYYGAAHWDGVEWKLERLFWNSSNVYGIQSIWGESSDDFWVAVGSIFHWNGSVLEQRYQVLGTQKALRSVWGTDYSNLYFAGNGGNIVHYDGSNFKQMISGTDIDLKRISGNDKGNVFVTGYEKDLESTALELNSNGWSELYHSSGTPNLPQNNYGRFISVWCGEQNSFFITVGGLLKFNMKHRIDNIIFYSTIGVYPFYARDINGQAENDFFMVDNNCRIVHWNGKSWSAQNEIFDSYPDERLYVYGSDYKQNVIAIVGEIDNGSQGFIVIGKKY